MHIETEDYNIRFQKNIFSDFFLKLDLFLQ